MEPDREANTGKRVTTLKWRLTKMRLFLALCGLLALMAAARVCLPTTEPRYQGKTIQQWFNLIGKSKDPRTREDRAKEVLVEIGEPAVPFLIKQFTNGRSAPSNLEVFFEQLHNTIPWFPASISWRMEARRERPVAYAWQVLHLMGPKAKAAVPDLLQIATNKAHPKWSSAIMLLGDIHSYPEQVVPVLAQSLEGKYAYDASIALSQFGLEARSAVPALRAAIQDTNVWTPPRIAFALLSIGDSLDLALPVIAECLSSKKHDQTWMIDKLATLQERAKPAVPYLMKCLQDPDREVRKRATKALRQIDPEAAAKAGIQ